MAVSKTPVDFGRNMRARMAQFTEGAEARKHAAYRAGAQHAIVSTPVDVGLARSNWIGTVKSPANFSRARAFSPLPQETLPSKFFESANAQGAIKAAEAVVASAGLGVPMFVTNNVGYIGFLNDGGSVQMGAGFFERAALVGRLEARSGGRIFKD